MFEKVETIAKKIYEDSKESHGFSHIDRVLKLALRIGKNEGADLEIIKIAALLHDIGRKAEDESKGKICHAKEGAKLAKQILEEMGWGADKISKAVHCIKTHRFRNDLIPATLEAKVLSDADKLDSIGAVGIGKAFLFSGEIGAMLHNKEKDVLKTEAYSQDDTAYREFMVKLRHIKDRMLTKEGRRIAEERHAFMENFFSRLNDEVDAIK